VRESCSAAVLDGSEIVYVLRVPTQKIMSLNLGIGSRLPAYCTSMGRMMLAGLPPEEQRRRLQALPRPRHTARTVTDEAALLERIAEAGRQGWCLVDQELEEGLISLAAPIRDRGGRLIAALNISGQPGRTPPAMMTGQLLPRLLEAARQISELLQRKA
jgi:IclR family pca regulon transcriptional regulator